MKETSMEGGMEATARRNGSMASGYSLIEALIGAALLLIVVLGVLPLFTRAMLDNTAGADYSRTANNARSTAEQMSQLGFNNASLTLAAGQTSLVLSEYYSETQKRWLPRPGTLPTGTQWLRTATIQQYGAFDFYDDGILNQPLPGGTFPSYVHFKQIDVVVEPASTDGVLGARRRSTLRLVKAF